jgi:microcystin-dependent protein
MNIDQFVGQLVLAAFGFTPSGWAQCNGQLMAINSNQALFALLGVAFGGDGMRNFALPNLQGRTPLGMNGQFPMGAIGGEAQHLLTPNEVPSHTHSVQVAASGANVGSPQGAIVAGGGATCFTPAGNLKAMASGSVSMVGGQAHENRQPYLVMNWCIALNGIFPSRN